MQQWVSGMPGMSRLRWTVVFLSTLAGFGSVASRRVAAQLSRFAALVEASDAACARTTVWHSARFVWKRSATNSGNARGAASRAPPHCKKSPNEAL